MTPRQILLALVPPVCWGVGFTIAKPAVAQFPPLFMMLMVYGGIAAWLSLRDRTRIETSWSRMLLISSLAVTIQGALIFVGLKGLAATTANLVLQIQVPMAVILGWLVGGETLSPRKSLGTLIAIAGVAMVIGLPEETPPLVPVALIVAGALAWALGQVLARKLGRDDGPRFLRASAIAAIPQLLLATLVFESGQIASLRTASLGQWAALLFVGVVGFYAAYAAWYSLLRQCRIDEVAPFVLLMPVFGICAAFLVLGETIAPEQIVGGLIILAGLAIVSGLGPLANAKAGRRARP